MHIPTLQKSERIGKTRIINFNICIPTRKKLRKTLKYATRTFSVTLIFYITYTDLYDMNTMKPKLYLTMFSNNKNFTYATVRNWDQFDSGNDTHKKILRQFIDSTASVIVKSTIKFSINRFSWNLPFVNISSG